MPTEELELMQLATDRFNAGDLDGFADLLVPAATIHPDPSWPEPGPFEAREGRIAAIRAFFDHDEALRFLA